MNGVREGLMAAHRQERTRWTEGVQLGQSLDRHVCIHTTQYSLWCWGMESIVVGVDTGEI